MQNTTTIGTKKPASFIAKGHTFQDEIVIRGIKIMDIGYIAIIYTTIAFILSQCIDKLYGTFDPKAEDKKPAFYIYINVISHLFLIGILTYFIRNIVEQIPYPFNGIRGYDHLRLKELGSAALFTTTFMFYQTNLRDKMNYIAKRYGTTNDVDNIITINSVDTTNN
jgi:hypothetical protein